MFEAQTWGGPAHLTAPIGVEVVPFVVVCRDFSLVVLLQMCESIQNIFHYQRNKTTNISTGTTGQSKWKMPTTHYSNYSTIQMLLHINYNRYGAQTL
jgi:hypothetical protein